MSDSTIPPETVELSAYSPMWPAVFDIERGRLIEIFGADSVLIEHVGSTAVPGLGAKPIIDILLGAPTLAVVDRHIPALIETGYRHVQEVGRVLPERRYLVKTHGHPGHFHLHAVVQGSQFWKDQLAFRDVLREDPALVARYWRLKTALAARHRNDRAAYSDGRSEFIKNTLATRAT